MYRKGQTYFTLTTLGLFALMMYFYSKTQPQQPPQ